MRTTPAIPRSVLSREAIHGFMERVRDVLEDGRGEANAPSFEDIARRWQDMGIRPGDLVLLCLPNGKAVLQHFFGALWAGAVPALLSPNTPSARLREISSALGVRAIAALRIAGSEDGQRRERIGSTEVVVLPSRVQPAAHPGQVVLLTSGTSGFSSGCIFDVEQLLLNGERHADAVGQRPADVVLLSLPLCFSFGLVAQALGTLVRGGRLLIDGPPFHAPTYLRVLSDLGVTISALTPVLVRSVLQCAGGCAGGWPASSLRVLSVGGDALAPEHVEQLLWARPGGELYLTYGLTQAGPRVATLAAHAEPCSRYASVGLPLPGTDVSLCDLDDGSGRKQLIVSSATVAKRVVGTVEGRRRHDLIAPGTVATGDVFEQDAAGYLYFRGRLSDYIVRNGEKICLAAIRRVASQLPHVVSAKTVAVGREDNKDDYDLGLNVAIPPKTSGLDYERLLRSWLRSSEMPRRVGIVASEPAGSLVYK